MSCCTAPMRWRRTSSSGAVPTGGKASRAHRQRRWSTCGSCTRTAAMLGSCSAITSCSTTRSSAAASSWAAWCLLARRANLTSRLKAPWRAPPSTTSRRSASRRTRACSVTLRPWMVWRSPPSSVTACLFACAAYTASSCRSLTRPTLLHPQRAFPTKPARRRQRAAAAAAAARRPRWTPRSWTCTSSSSMRSSGQQCPTTATA
mmetsp:Transcript_40959/g.127649  ORF Transcript_40959/g.127649 Transcript_40959/m.127649 type:complete len:204 (+) Transcript_40959:295-906(+)